MSLGASPVTSGPLGQLLGESPALAAVREQVERLLRRQAEGARRLAPILILGETGTGKGLLAGILHRAGPRAAGPFVDVNCAAIPETLLEAELFGFERGAFTDARHAKPGLLQTAHRGMLFLDEVGLLPEGLQAKLLKVLEERSVRRLGSTRSEPVDVWIVAATSEDLQAATRARRFREDLYHRLAVLTLRMPPLRERGEDIVRLAEHFLGQACADYGLAPRTLAPDARVALLTHPWPGNVRELANTMERVALLVDGTTVTAAMMGLQPAPSRSMPASDPATARRAVVEAEAEAEQGRLLEALRTTKWNISRAAARLGIPRNTLRYRMDRHGLGSGSSLRRPLARAPESAPMVPVEAARDVTAPDHRTARPAAPEGLSPRGLRWESRRVTLLGARLETARATPESLETRRAMDAALDKVLSFGGRIDVLGLTHLVAAFGLEPVDDAPRHAASAALAIEKVGARARRDNPTRPAVTLALHTAIVPVARHDERVEIDADAKQPAYTLLKALEERAEPGSVVVSPQAAAVLARHFELAHGVPGAAGAMYRLVGASEADRRLTGFVGRGASFGCYSIDSSAFGPVRARWSPSGGTPGSASPGSCGSSGATWRVGRPGWKAMRSPSAGRSRSIR